MSYTALRERSARSGGQSGCFYRPICSIVLTGRVSEAILSRVDSARQSAMPQAPASSAVSRPGERPKNRLYSRLNWDGLSYPTRTETAAALKPLGVALVISVPPGRTASGGHRHGLGRDGYPSIWFHDGETPIAPVHVAFAVEDRALVDAFHSAALAAGGGDNGAPCVRHHYHDAYYAAYVLDADGNNIEVVFQT